MACHDLGRDAPAGRLQAERVIPPEIRSKHRPTKFGLVRYDPSLRLSRVSIKVRAGWFWAIIADERRVIMRDERPAAESGQASGGRMLRLGPNTVTSWLILVASLGVALAIYYGFVGSVWVEYVAEWTAQWTSQGLRLLGTSTTVDGTILRSDSFAVSIVAECTAVGPLVLYTGAVLAYPATARAKGLGIAIGLVVLTLVNVVRIVSLFLLGSAYPQYLEIAHLLVWQTAIILFAIVLWLLWVERIAGAGNR